MIERVAAVAGGLILTVLGVAAAVASPTPAQGPPTGPEGEVVPPAAGYGAPAPAAAPAPAPAPAAVAPTSGATATAPPEALPGVFGDVLEVRVVNLEVVVTDRDGARVRGLSPQDFRLKVDGKEVPIDYFSEVTGGIAGAALPGVESVPSVSSGEAVGTSYLVFVDDSFSLRVDRNRVLEKLREQLGYLGPHDRMAIVSFDGKRLEMLSTWSQSRPALERVLRAELGHRTHGIERRAQWGSVERDRQLLGDGAVYDRSSAVAFRRLGVEGHYYAQELRNRSSSRSPRRRRRCAPSPRPPGAR